MPGEYRAGAAEIPVLGISSIFADLGTGLGDWRSVDEVFLEAEDIAHGRNCRWGAFHAPFLPCSSTADTCQTADYPEALCRFWCWTKNPNTPWYYRRTTGQKLWNFFGARRPHDNISSSSARITRRLRTCFRLRSRRPGPWRTLRCRSRSSWHMWLRLYSIGLWIGSCGGRIVDVSDVLDL